MTKNNTYNTFYFYMLLTMLLFNACQKDNTSAAKENLLFTSLEIPTGFPFPEIPEGNELTTARVELGRQLFYDPILSRDSTLSCASCHQQEFAFADNRVFSLGVDDLLGTRNATSLSNVAYQERLLREGGVATIEMQVLVPIQEHNEFDFNIVLVAERLKNNPHYVTQSWEAYEREPDPFVITRSIAAFERTLISGNSAYDKYTFQGEDCALNKSQKRGLALFNSKRLACAACHSDFNFTNNTYENNGLYDIYADNGRERLTELPEDRAKFKVPSLRNIALTAPYMHDGSLGSLEAVISHYESGGANHENKSKLITGFTLTKKEKEDLINFLNTLTDYDFINNPQFSKPIIE